ncbi:MAG: hypothetical protein GTO40_07285 [Deltaproteobacteria bacterium]|nr:hypothetical protein [Deltaproteobacteria bacterium]
MLILEALRASELRARYRPVDASQALLEIACAVVIDARFPCHGVQTDIMSPDHFTAWKGNNPSCPMNFSHKVSPETFLSVLSEVEGIQCLTAYYSEDGRLLSTPVRRNP